MIGVIAGDQDNCNPLLLITTKTSISSSMLTILSSCPNDLRKDLRLLRSDSNQLSLSFPGSVTTYVEVRSPDPLSFQESTTENDHLLIVPTEKPKVTLARSREWIISVEAQLPKALGSYPTWNSASRYEINSEPPVVQEYPDYQTWDTTPFWSLLPGETVMPTRPQDSIEHADVRELLRQLQEVEDRRIFTMWEDAARALEASARENLFPVTDSLELPGLSFTGQRLTGFRRINPSNAIDPSIAGAGATTETTRVTLRRNRFDRIPCE